MRRTANLARRDWDNHILSGAGWRTRDRKCQYNLDPLIKGILKSAMFRPVMITYSLGRTIDNNYKKPDLVGPAMERGLL